MRTSSNTWNQATVQNDRVVVQNVQERQNRVQGNNARGVVAVGNRGLSTELPKRPQNSDYFKEKMLLMQAQENGVDLDEEQLLFLAGGSTNTFDDEVDEGPVQDMAQNEDNIFQADQCDAFSSDVDEAPTTQIMFMANLSSADPVYDEAGPSYDSDTLSEDNEDQVIHSDVSFVPNDAVMIITNDIYEQDTPCVTSNNIVNASLTAKLARYKELAEMRMIIKDRNVKEESLQQELHSVKTNNREVHLEYLKHLKESVGTLREIVEEAKVEKPLDSSFASACLYTKHSLELLEYVIGTCPKDFNKRDRKIATAPLNRKKVKNATATSRSKPRSNTKKDRTLPAKSDMKKVEGHSRNNKSSVKQKNRVDSSISFKCTFSVGDKVVIKVLLWKGVVRFGKRNKLSPRYVGPFEIVERVGPVAYRLRLPQELVGIHDKFHMSNLKKCMADVNFHVPLEEIKIDNGLRFVEEPIEVMDRDVNKLKKSRIPIVKVC
ncbi:hypothetical protein Tco_0477547 [Tanacetum coccineum]